MQGRVISGHKVALETAMAEATKKGALKAVPLAVSGAFHTKLMQPARDALLQVRHLLQMLLLYPAMRHPWQMYLSRAAKEF